MQSDFYTNVPLVLRYFLQVLFLLLSSNVSFSQENPAVPPGTDGALDQELRYLQAETYVITASRIPENIKKTAASITVVTDKQIREMGARNLIDVLETVPGWSNWYALNGFNLSNVRGIANQMASAILIMINSHPLNENWSGTALYTYDIVALDRVQRIEFVRGPGSARLKPATAQAGCLRHYFLFYHA